jgi:putative molybdopterin biosynthesis protein
MPNTRVALRLAKLLGTSVEALFGGQEAELELEGVREGQSRVLVTRVRGRWRALSSEAPDGLEPSFAPADGILGAGWDPELAERSALLVGCDPAFGILAGLASKGDARVLFRYGSSADALAALADGRCHAAGIHLSDADGGEGGRAPSEATVEAPAGHERFVFATWEQGLMVARGNPLGLAGVADLARRGVRFRNRPEGSGCRRMLDRALGEAGVAANDIADYGRESYSHWTSARAVEQREADAGLGLRAVAVALGLGFVPWMQVRCELLIPADLLEHPGVRALLDTLHGAELRRQVAALPGYETGQTGRRLGSGAA